MKYLTAIIFSLLLAGCGLYGGGDQDNGHDYGSDVCDYGNPDRDLPENNCGAGNQ